MLVRDQFQRKRHAVYSTTCLRHELLANVPRTLVCMAFSRWRPFVSDSADGTSTHHGRRARKFALGTSPAGPAPVGFFRSVSTQAVMRAPTTPRNAPSGGKRRHSGASSGSSTPTTSSALDGAALEKPKLARKITPLPEVVWNTSTQQRPFSLQAIVDFAVQHSFIVAFFGAAALLLWVVWKKGWAWEAVFEDFVVDLIASCASLSFTHWLAFRSKQEESSRHMNHERMFAHSSLPCKFLSHFDSGECLYDMTIVVFFTTVLEYVNMSLNIVTRPTDDDGGSDATARPTLIFRTVTGMFRVSP